MQGLSISAINRLTKREKEAELTSIRMLRGTNFTQCVVLNGLSPQIMVTDHQGKEVAIRARDIFNATTWDKFLLSTSRVNAGLCQLTDMAEKLAEEYEFWLLHNHTKSYRGIKKPDDTVWFQRVIVLTVIRRIMENKYQSEIVQGNEDIFADQEAKAQMNFIMSTRESLVEFAKMVNHVYKNPEDKEQRDSLIVDLFNGFFQKLLRAPLPSALLSQTLESLGMPLEETEENGGIDE